MIFLISFLIVFLTTAGQIFLKLGADRATKPRFINGYVLSGYVLFLLTIMFSYYLMKIVPMKYFTVLMSLNYITVMFAARIFLSEKINKDRLIGTILIATGVFVFVLK
ncbi:MAG: EamA family transporter [Thiotrichaceae bacterium]|nr:EamA family transporter [Thiotrichaceae bacterium]